VVSLRPEDVVCFVFWSKNYAPFLEPLDVIDGMGYHSFFHFTITGLPDVFESNVVPVHAAVDTLKKLSERYSPVHITWRYDPIIISDRTPPEFHRKTFERIAASLAGHVERCTISYVDLYGKVRRSFKRFQEKTSTTITDPDRETRIRLAGELASIAKGYGIKMYSCCEEYLICSDIMKGRCVDGGLIGKLFGVDTSGFNVQPTRKECGCTESTDIGAYDTCPHGCIYCYANVNKEKARKAYETHDEDSAFLGYSG
jgi:DNA repair photolyase